MRARPMFRWAWRLCAAALLLCAVGAVQAQSDDGGGDPPDRVARLSWLQGDVGLLPSGAQDWGEASINRPLTRGDRLSSSDGSRAELELDGAALRLDGGTDVGFLALDDSIAQLELTQGTLNLTVRRLDDGESYEIDTPTVALVVDHPGTFRVDVDRDGRGTRVTAFDGSATVYGENGAQRPVIAGRSYRFADASLDDVVLEDVGGGDDFDAWCQERDRRYAGSVSRRYVSEDVIGYQDLDRYGQWRSDPDYGTVWYPADVDADWAPYRDGHWAWVAPWGWTWVDDAPWGFAPYHYGRWAWRRDGWCWVPGPIGWRPVYAPALVAFVGGSHWSVSVGSAPVGWFPLGPGEIYDPWYRSSRRYYTQVNVTNIYVRNRTVIVNRIDRRYDGWRRGIAPPVRALGHGTPRGFTAVPARAFADADRVQPHRLRIDPRELRGAAVLTRAATPKPTARSFVPPRPAQARPLPAQGFRREVVARHAPREAIDAGRPARGPVRGAADQRVRVLRPRPDTLPAVAHFAPAPRAEGAGPRAVPARPATRELRAAPLRPGELPSARFVRRPEPAQPAGRPRPGVSFVSSAQADRERAARAAPGLPQVPRIERAGAPAPAWRRPDVAPPRDLRAPDFAAQQRAARIEAARRQAAMQERPMPRGESARPVPPMQLREPDAAMRARAMPPRVPQADAFRPVPQAAPAPRAAPANGSQGGAQSRGHREPPRRFDAQH
ncbi:DUF6600 domain-containing protein [Fulvimonas yonginensis]|uniref:DUF6600 domain-containing protein n=1 Tax=Fulvimonas yonginensis TaxID=1495200 RepID=A0ABU8J917_9GAMM